MSVDEPVFVEDGHHTRLEIENGLSSINHTITLSSDSCPSTPEMVPPGSVTPPLSYSESIKNSVKKRKVLSHRALGVDRSSDKEVTCPICLGEVENKSMTDTCRHKFCFTCLLEWSKVKAVCPLCKVDFTSIMHNIRSDSNYDTHTVPPPSQSRKKVQSRQILRRRRRAGTSDFRRDVYRRDLWAQPVVGGRFRECTPDWYRTNEAQTHRLVPWLNRELNVLSDLFRHRSREENMINRIIKWVKRYHITGPDMRDHLLPYLGTRTNHFQHEFYNFARSPYDLEGYYRNVTYDTRSLPTVIVSSDSDDESD